MNASKNPRFSVVIPCYNEENYIGDTLASLQQQRFEGGVEVIVVDNNSTDNSRAIITSFRARIVNEKHQGVCWARQAGTKAARGEIVISTDADTIFDPEWLTRIDAAFSACNDCVAVTGPCQYRSGPFWGKAYIKILFGGVNLYTKAVGRPFYVTATNLAFKKSVWKGYDVTAPNGGDELGLLRQLKKQGTVAFNLGNPVYTSARRLKRGLFYNIFVSAIFYYFCGYFIDRIFKRTIIGSAPAYRFIIDEEARTQKVGLGRIINPFANKIDS